MCVCVCGGVGGGGWGGGGLKQRRRGGGGSFENCGFWKEGRRVFIKPSRSVCFPPSDLYCPKGWVQADTSCYVAPPGAASWARARQRCLALGADLVSINSARENKAVASLTTNLRRRDVWIGLFPDPGDKKRWLWSDGSRPGFTGWRRWDAMRFMTARRCIRHTPNGLWWYSACEHEKYFVCEKEGKPATSHFTLSLPSSQKKWIKKWLRATSQPTPFPVTLTQTLDLTQGRGGT